MGLISKLRLLFAYGPELEIFLKHIREERAEKDRRARLHHLNLCVKHQQESNRSHYTEKNCHYCQLQAKIDHLEVSKCGVICSWKARHSI